MLYNIEQFIYFLVDLTNEIYYEKFGYIDAKYYFLHGGCLDFAKVLKHYFIDSDIVIHKQIEHYALLYQDHIYDCTGEREDKDSFRKATIEDFNNFYLLGFNEISYANGKYFVDVMLKEIENCNIKK